VGPNYTPSSTDQRHLKLTFNDGSGAVALSQDHIINSVPYAQYANQLNGINNTDILQVNLGTAQLTQANLETVFSNPSDATNLRDLIDGNSANYLISNPAASVGFNSQRVTEVGSPTDGTDATNKNYVDSSLGGETLNPGPLGAGNTGEVLTWDGSQWVSQATSGGDILDGGNSSGASLVLGTNDTQELVFETDGVPAITVDTAQGVSFAGGIGVTGGVNAGGDINLLSQSEIKFQDTADGEFIGFRAPASLTGSTLFTLPAGDGVANQVLSTDGSGNLLWTADNDSISTVFGRSGAVTALASDYDAEQIDNIPSGNISSSNVQAAIDELDAEKLAKTGGSLNGNLKLDNNSELQLSEDSGNGVDFLGFKAPSSVTANTVWELPDGDGSTGQVLQTDGSGVLSWSTPAAAGEVNTVSNAGAGGVGVFDTKNAVDFEFKNINAGSAKVTVTDDGANREIDIDVVEANIDHNALSSYVANEHIDHSLINVGTAVDSGLSGGGDLTASRNLSIDILGTTDLAAVADNADSLLLYDLSTTSLKEVTRSELVLSESEVDTFVTNNGFAIDADVLKKDGSVALTGNLDAGSNTISNLGAPTAGSDAANKTYVDGEVSTINSSIGGVTSSITGINSSLSGLTADVGNRVNKAGDTMTGALNLDNQNEIQFSEDDANGSNYVALRAPVSVGSNLVWTLPSTNGASGQALLTDGAGALSWGSTATALNGLADASTDYASDSMFIGEGAGAGLTTGTDNTIIGERAFHQWGTGSRNTAIGTDAMFISSNPATSMNDSTAIGFQALGFNDNGSENTAVGAKALFNDGEGHGNGNVGVGFEAGLSQTSSVNSTFMGRRAGLSAGGTSNIGIGNTAFQAGGGSENLAIGTGAGQFLKGDSNIAIGTNAIFTNGLPSEADENVAIGHSSMGLSQSKTGSRNVAIGHSSMGSVSTGQQNTSLGYQAGLNTNTGSDNVNIGYRAGQNLTSGSNNITIGANVNAEVDVGSDQLNIGNLIYGDLANNKVGIGTSTPTADGLHIVGETNSVATGEHHNVTIKYDVNPSGDIPTGLHDRLGLSSITEIPATSSNRVFRMFGIGTQALNSGSGDVPGQMGGLNAFAQTNSGAVSWLNGVHPSTFTTGGNVTHQTSVGTYSAVGGGTVEHFMGFRSQNFIFGGSVNNMYGIHIINSNFGGTNTNRYGVFIANEGGGIPTGVDYGIFQEAPSADNFFAGAVGIGLSVPTAKLHVNGSGAGGGVCVTSDGICGAIPDGGEISAETTLNTGADYAEYFISEESLPSGALVGLNPETGKVRGYQSGDSLIGVVSTDPGVIGNSKLKNEDQAVLVALVGQVPVLEDRVSEKDGVVFTHDKKALGYRLSNGHIYLNISSGSESLSRKVASQDEKISQLEKARQELQSTVHQLQSESKKAQSENRAISDRLKKIERSLAQ